MAKKHIDVKAEKDTGFSDKYGFGNQRVINRDGSFNVERKGLPFLKGFNLYDELMVCSKGAFFFFLLGTYLLINLIFTLLYAFIGFEGIVGLESESFTGQFTEVFFFSTQTFATVGYGTMSPGNFSINLIATIEAFVGLLSFAIATGLLYGRFARPKAKLLFSDQAIIAPYKDGKGLMFRFANIRKSEMTEVEAQLIIAYTEDEQRKFFRPKLEIDKINFLTTSWTIVHPIDEDSPLKDLAQEDLHEFQLEILILIKGFDDNFAQTISTRTSYTCQEIKVGYKFKKVFMTDKNGRTYVNLKDLSEMEKIEA